MNILHIVPSVGPQSYGLGQVAVNLVKAQQALQQKSEIWCLDSQEIINKVIIDNNLSKGSIKGFRCFGKGSYRVSIKLFAELFKTRNDFQIIHQHGIWTPLSLWVLLYSRKFKIRIIIAPHGSLNKIAYNKSNIKKKIALLLYERANFNNASAFHATSINEANDIKDFGIQKRIFLINNGISKEWINNSIDPEHTNDFLSKISLDSNSRIMLYMSRITPKKNLGTFINAWASIQKDFPTWHFLIIGGDEMGYKKEMQNLVKKHDIENRVTFCEPMFGEEKINAFAAAEIMVLPSLSEGFPIVILDSLGAGVPVLTSKNLSWEALEEFRCGWVVKPMETDLENKLKLILSLDRTILENMGRNGRKLVTESFLWENIARQTLEEYKSILDMGEC